MFMRVRNFLRGGGFNGETRGLVEGELRFFTATLKRTTKTRQPQRAQWNTESDTKMIGASVITILD